MGACLFAHAVVRLRHASRPPNRRRQPTGASYIQSLRLPLLHSPPPFALLCSLPADIAALSWSKASRGSVLNVKRSEGPALTFLGFRDKDVEALRSLTNLPIADEPLATTCEGLCGVHEVLAVTL